MRMILTALLLTLSLRALAPSEARIPILRDEPIQPYERIWQAVITVESGGDSLAVGDKHLKEKSYGISQLRRVRIEDYNARTGSHYTVQDAFSPEVSKRIFMYFAELIGPYDTDLIIRAWNGISPKSYKYLAKVRRHL